MIRPYVSFCPSSVLEELKKVYEEMDDLQDLYQLEASIVDEPSCHERGGIIKGYQEDIDISRKPKQRERSMAGKLEAEKRKTGIRTLKLNTIGFRLLSGGY